MRRPHKAPFHAAPLPVLAIALALAVAAPAVAQQPPVEPPVKVTTFAMKHPGVPDETVIGAMRALEAGLKRNERLEMKDLDTRLAEFAQEVPQDTIDTAHVALKEGQEALKALNIAKAIQRLQEAVEGLSKVLPYIKKQELADAMAALAVAQYEGGDKKAGKEQFIRLLTWRSDYLYDPTTLPPKYKDKFDEAQLVVDTAKKGSLEIISEPAGALAYVDGKQVANLTPCIADTLTVGEHFVTFKKEGYKKSVIPARVSAKKQEKVLMTLDRSDKYLLVEQALEKVEETLGADMSDPDTDNLKQVLFIDHAVFVRAKPAGDDKVEFQVYLYDLRNHRKLSSVLKTVPRTQAEAQLAQLAANLYLNVSYEAELIVPKDDLPKQKLARTPIYKAWWFWTAAVAVLGAAAGTTAAIVLTRAPSCPEGSACIHITN
ncbi:MAG: PEGA domain-containing protein [Myxococcales bacterium]|nr:PEGA domain-containing protein [Myxococcales bacterium]